MSQTIYLSVLNLKFIVLTCNTYLALSFESNECMLPRKTPLKNIGNYMRSSATSLMRWFNIFSFTFRERDIYVLLNEARVFFFFLTINSHGNNIMRISFYFLFHFRLFAYALLRIVVFHHVDVGHRLARYLHHVKVNIWRINVKIQAFFFVRIVWCPW